MKTKNLKIIIPTENSTNVQWAIFQKAAFIELQNDYESTDFLQEEILNRWNKHKKESFVLNT
jgi:hypothetical protein|tara:strand:- start:5475 stop:5660 length:186 start_codon:yes stop_codon:yes gene_type:complete